MALTIMNLEAQLLLEIKERQEKLDKVRGVSPKLQELEALLNECQSVCNEFGMQDLFLGVLGNFTAPVSTPTTSQPQDNLTTATNTNTNSVLTDKEAKIIRQELKTFLKYEGQRLSDTTIKNLLIEKLEELSKQDLLAEVNLDDKNNFLVEAKKLANLLTLAKEETLTEAKEETLTEAKEETLTEAKEETLTTPINPNPAPQVMAEEVNKEDGLNPADVIKSALVQNSITGYYGTVEKDGVLNNAVLVRYPQETLSTPLSELKLIQPAIIKSLPTPTITHTQEEMGNGDYSPQTPQELTMWENMVEIFESEEELIAMAQDKETIANFNLANGTNLTTLPIADLYEYTTGNPRIS